MKCRGRGAGARFDALLPARLGPSSIGRGVFGEAATSGTLKDFGLSDAPAKKCRSFTLEAVCIILRHVVRAEQIDCGGTGMVK